MYKLKVQKDKCIACGMCALECNVLQEDSSGKVEVIGAGVVADSEVGKVRNVVELCPAKALSLTEEFVNVGAKLAELKSKMQQPLTFTPPPKSDYRFMLEDSDQYAMEIWQNSFSGVSGEDDFDYKSSSSAKSAGERAFRDEIYSQAEALAQQVIVMYEQRKMNRVARYAETSGNYKYGVHQRLIADLRSFVNELESYTGKKISLPSNFFTFRTKDTEYINDRQEHANDWLASRIKGHLEPASEFYGCVKTNKTYEYVTVSSWFGPDKEKMIEKYAYYIDGDNSKRFYRRVARTACKDGKYTSQFCERELDRFHKEIEEEWKSKINYLLRQV
ncbi:MAG: ferredoxin [Selenomonadaceae bacterium]|nr:ferredoxin [Selenomonadaceae bacterium]